MSECKDLVAKLLDHPKSSMAHHKFLFVQSEGVKGSGVAAALSCNLSGLPLCRFLMKGDIDGVLLQRLLTCGAQLSLNDIDTAVKVFPNDDKHVKLIEIMLNRLINPLQPSSLEELCDLSLKHGKDLFLAHFTSCGAKPSTNAVFQYMNWKTPDRTLLMSTLHNASKLDRTKALITVVNNSIDLAPEVLECGEIDYSHLDLGPLIESSSLAMAPKLMEKLLILGVSPNGFPDTRVRPLDAVLYGLKQHSPERKAMLILMLVRHKADLSRSCRPREEGTTVIHKATELALLTGMCA